MPVLVPATPHRVTLTRVRVSATIARRITPAGHTSCAGGAVAWLLLAALVHAAGLLPVIQLPAVFVVFVVAIMAAVDAAIVVVVSSLSVQPLSTTLAFLLSAATAAAARGSRSGPPRGDLLSAQFGSGMQRRLFFLQLRMHKTRAPAADCMHRWLFGESGTARVLQRHDRCCGGTTQVLLRHRMGVAAACTNVTAVRHRCCGGTARVLQ
eukprot:353133-Chlamydomonas_euryale.AAC.2